MKNVDLTEHILRSERMAKEQVNRELGPGEDIQSEDIRAYEEDLVKDFKPDDAETTEEYIPEKHEFEKEDMSELKQQQLLEEGQPTEDAPPYSGSTMYGGPAAHTRSATKKFEKVWEEPVRVRKVDK